MIPAALCLEPQIRGAGMPDGPVRAALWDGGLGSAQSTCPRDALDAQGRGYLLADTPAFYGQIVASGTLSGRISVDPRTQVGLGLEVVRYQDVIGAVPSSFLGYGFTTVSAMRLLSDDGPRLAVTGRAVLPTAIGLFGQTWPVGVDVGLAGAAGGERLEVHGQAGVAGSGAISKGPTQVRLGVPLTVGGAWKPGSAFALVADVQAALGYTAPLDHLAVAPAVRFAGGRSWGLELGATVPLAGRERALTAAELTTSWRL